MYRTLYEGGNAIAQSNPVNQVDVPGIIAAVKRELPSALLKNLQVDIGSAGFKVDASGKSLPSGDIDVMVEAADVVSVFETNNDPKDPVKAAKQAMKTYFEAKGIEAVPNGRNVSIGIKYKEQATGKEKVAQVDIMVIHDVNVVAPYHQHGPRGMYKDPTFKGNAIFILMNSIGKFLGLKFDAFGAKLMRRDDNTVVARSRDEVAKILLNPKATADDLNSVGTIIAALANDPDKEGKLAQAKQDQAKGLLTLPETAPTPGTAAWFRKMGHTL